MVLLEVFDAGERLDQRGAHDFQLAAMVGCQLVEQPRAPGRDAQQNAAGIGLVAGALEQAFFHGTVRKFNHAVVAQTEALGSVGDGRNRASRRSGNLQQQLMLLWLQASGVRCLLAELYERPKAVAKFRQPLDKA